MTGFQLGDAEIADLRDFKDKYIARVAKHTTDYTIPATNAEAITAIDRNNDTIAGLLVVIKALAKRVERLEGNV